MVPGQYARHGAGQYRRHLMEYIWPGLLTPTPTGIHMKSVDTLDRTYLNLTKALVYGWVLIQLYKMLYPS